MTHRPVLAALLAAAFTGAPAWAENVEIYATDLLDNVQNGYCLDIAGGQGPQADPANGLQGHTCYSPSGELFVDQTFASERFGETVLYMPEFDVCATTASMDAGAALGLAACDGSDAQAFSFSGEGTITLASAPEMCVTLGQDTRTGRSPTNQIKTLTLEACGDERAAYQSWANRTAE